VPDGGLRFGPVKAPDRGELEELVRRIAERWGALERRGCSGAMPRARGWICRLPWTKTR